MADNPPATPPGLHLRPMVHVVDMPASVAFYEQLGGEVVHGTRDGDWVLMQLGTTQIGLLACPPDPMRGETTVELTFAAAMPLDALAARLRTRGALLTEGAADTHAGVELQVRSPDGLLIKINQREPDGDR
jgi:hypothetical protein